VTSKLWNADQGYEEALAGFETSRAKLGLDYVDL
jgi:diketogulonate reductase-like aldo/keto reductase